MSSFNACAAAAVGFASALAEAALRVHPFEHDRGVGAAEAERVRQYAAEPHMVAPLARDRHVGERRIETLDMGALADEAIVHHQQRVDRLMRAGGAERMAGERLGGRDRRAL